MVELGEVRGWQQDARGKKSQGPTRKQVTLMFTELHQARYCTLLALSEHCSWRYSTQKIQKIKTANEYCSHCKDILECVVLANHT